MRTVVAPEAAGLCVTSKVKGREFDVADGEFFGGGMESRLTGGQVSACELRHDVMVALQNCHPIVLKHVKKPVYVSGCFPVRRLLLRGLSSIVSASASASYLGMGVLSGHIQSEKKQLGVLLSCVSGAHHVACGAIHLVEQAKRRQNIVDYKEVSSHSATPTAMRVPLRGVCAAEFRPRSVADETSPLVRLR
jgi:hypothetical protein